MGQPMKAGRTPRRRRWAVLISGGTSLLLMVVVIGSLVAFVIDAAVDSQRFARRSKTKMNKQLVVWSA